MKIIPLNLLSNKIALSLGIIFTLVIFLFSQSVQASHKIPANTEQDVNLIKRLAEHPELLTVDYLEYYLGPKTQSSSSPALDASHTLRLVSRTFWNNASGQSVRYRLEKGQQNQNDCLARFSIDIPDQDGLRVKNTNKILGLEPVHSFDQNGHPADIYTSNPDTKILVYQAPGLVDLNQLVVQYIGPPLPPPSQIDIQEGISFRRSTAFQQEEKGNYTQSIPLLESHLQTNPNDAEAHFKLAEAYRAKSCLNPSITEYKAALTNCGNDTDLRNQCINGLFLLKVIPAPTNNQPANSIPPNIIKNPLNSDVGF